MPERPLVLFAAPTVADKERRYGGAPKYYFPSHSRQVSRLTPQFNVLQNTMNSGSIYFTNYAIFEGFFGRNSIEERKKILIISTIIAFQYMIMNNGVEEIMYNKVI